VDPRDRINCAFLHKSPDRTPVFEYVLCNSIADIILNRKTVIYEGSNPAAFNEIARENGYEAAVQAYVEDRLDIAAVLGHDMLYVCPSPAPHDPGGASPLAPYRRVADDPAENIRRRNQSSDNVVICEDAYAVFHCLKREMDRRGVDLPIMAPVCYHGVWTDTDLMETMLISPEDAEEHFRICTRRAAECIGLIAGVVDIFMVGGDFSGNRPIISPESYRKYIVPEVRKVSDNAHRLGKRAVNASDGALWYVIEDFLFGCDADGYNEIDMHAGMDLAKLKIMYGDKITLFGNMDSGNILTFGPESVVAAETRKCLEAGMGDGGHIFCVSNAIVETTPPEHYFAMVNAYREFFSMDRLSLT